MNSGDSHDYDSNAESESDVSSSPSVKDETNKADGQKTDLSDDEEEKNNHVLRFLELNESVCDVIPIFFQNVNIMS